MKTCQGFTGVEWVIVWVYLSRLYTKKVWMGRGIHSHTDELVDRVRSCWIAYEWECFNISMMDAYVLQTFRQLLFIWSDSLFQCLMIYSRYVELWYSDNNGHEYILTILVKKISHKYKHKQKEAKGRERYSVFPWVTIGMCIVEQCCKKACEEKW